MSPLPIRNSKRLTSLDVSITRGYKSTTRMIGDIATFTRSSLETCTGEFTFDRSTKCTLIHRGGASVCRIKTNQEGKHHLDTEQRNRNQWQGWRKSSLIRPCGLADSQFLSFARLHTTGQAPKGLRAANSLQSVVQAGSACEASHRRI